MVSDRNDPEILVLEKVFKLIEEGIKLQVSLLIQVVSWVYNFVTEHWIIALIVYLPYIPLVIKRPDLTYKLLITYCVVIKICIQGLNHLIEGLRYPLDLVQTITKLVSELNTQVQITFSNKLIQKTQDNNFSNLLALPFHQPKLITYQTKNQIQDTQRNADNTLRTQISETSTPQTLRVQTPQDISIPSIKPPRRSPSLLNPPLRRSSRNRPNSKYATANFEKQG